MFLNRFLSPDLHKTLVQVQRKQITSLKAKMDRDRKWSDRLADHINMGFGSMTFFICHVIFFAGWMLVNTGIISGFTPFDPYPFGFLTMVVSLEAIFLSIFVLISQNRAANIADVREEVDLQVNVRAEQEITRLISMIELIHNKLGLEPILDDELSDMKRHTNIWEIQSSVIEEMAEND